MSAHAHLFEGLTPQNPIPIFALRKRAFLTGATLLPPLLDTLRQACEHTILAHRSGRGALSHAEFLENTFAQLHQAPRVVSAVQFAARSYVTVPRARASSIRVAPPLARSLRVGWPANGWDRGFASFIGGGQPLSAETSM